MSYLDRIHKIDKKLTLSIDIESVLSYNDISA